MPIFEIVFSRPFAMPLIARFCASSPVMPSGSQPSSTSSSSVSSITYGLIAAAP